MANTEINIRANGPLLVRGEFQLLDGDGNSYDLEGKAMIALCRCGVSENAPFCDGAHKAAGFESTCTAS